MKKRLLSIISVFACLCVILSLSTTAKASSGMYTADVFADYMTTWMDTWFSGDLSAVESFNEEFKSSGMDVTYDVDEESYKSAVEKAGTFTEYNEPELTENGDVITVTQTAVCESQNVNFTFVFDTANAAVTWTVDVEKSAGELVVNALLNTLMGMGTVFVVLIFISFVIALFVFISIGDKKKKVTEAPAPVVATPVAPVVEADTMSDDEIIAVISAAIAAYEADMAGSDVDYEVPADGLYVRSIKKRGFC